MPIISFRYDAFFQCYNIEHLGWTTTDHALAPFHLEWFVVSSLQVSACKSDNSAKPLGEYFSHGVSLCYTKRCNRIGVPLLHLRSLRNNFLQAANQQ